MTKFTIKNGNTTTDNVMQYEPALCGVIVEFKRKNCGTTYVGYDKCGHPVKWKITYMKSTTGEMKTELVCGKHYIHAKKNAENLIKRFGFDNKFSAEPYNAT